MNEVEFDISPIDDLDKIKSLGSIWYVSKPMKNFYLKELGESLNTDVVLKECYPLSDENTFSFVIELNENKLILFNNDDYVREDNKFIHICGNIMNDILTYSVSFVYSKSYEDFNGYTSKIINPIIRKILKLNEHIILKVNNRFNSLAYKDYLSKYKTYYLNNVTLESVSEEKRDVIDFSVESNKIKCKDVLCVYNIYCGEIVKYHIIEPSEDYLELNNGDIILWRDNAFKLQSIKNKGLGYINYNYNKNYRYKKYRYLVLLHAISLFNSLNKEHIEKERYYHRCNKNISISRNSKCIHIRNKILGNIVIDKKNFNNHINKKHSEITLNVLFYILDNIAGVYKFSRGSKEMYVESYIDGELYRAVVQDNVVRTAYRVNDENYTRMGLYNYTFYEDKEMLSSYNFLVVNDFSEKEIKEIINTKE